jgi:hypothetical protein
LDIDASFATLIAVEGKSDVWYELQEQSVKKEHQMSPAKPSAKWQIGYCTTLKSKKAIVKILPA